MAGRGKVSVFLIFSVMTFGLLGLVSFHTLKERRNSTILLVAKYKEIDDLNNQYEELLEASKTNLSQAKKEKDNLIHKINDLENSKKLHHAICKEDKEKYKIKKDQEITTLKEKLQSKDVELTKTRAKIELLKLNNKKVNEGMVIKTIVRDDILGKDQEPFVKTRDNKDSKSKIHIPQNIANDEKINDVGKVVEESNAVDEAKVEDTDDVNKASPKENDIKTNKTVEEEDDEKELEVEMEASDIDTTESNKSQIQE